MIRVLHTADVHLGRQFPGLHHRGSDYRNQLLKTFDKIADLAKQEKVSLLLVAGDLFDSNRVYGTTVGKTLSALKKLDAAGIRVCIIPGTHDPPGDDSVYRSVSFPPNVTVFPPEHNQQPYPDLDVTVYGLSAGDGSSGKNPLAGLTINPATKFHIGMAHCSVRRDGIIENEDSLLNQEEIARSGLDYLALGHWHSFLDLSQGSTVACYSGSPEPIDMDQKGAGNVVMVTLQDKNNVKMEPHHIGSKRIEPITIDVSPFESVDGVVNKIEALADPNLILDVTLTGLWHIEPNLDIRELEGSSGEHFFILRIRDQSSQKLDDIGAPKFPEKTVAGRFLSIVEDKIADAKDEEDKALYEEAKRLGLALLQGRSQVIE